MDQTLDERRLAAAEASGGTSGSEIKDLVLRLIRQERLAGSVLDFGAGRGELIGKLLDLGTFPNVSGADILERPVGLPESVHWYHQDLNGEIAADERFDVVICSEVIEHLENPRAAFRLLYSLLKPGGTLILTMPNQECIRSYAALLFGGHFVQFLGVNYPAHITALLRTDLTRICTETGFTPCGFAYTNVGGIPKLPRVKWQQVSFGLLRGRLFSDNLGLVARKPG
ncbi:MAG: methyltransferase domain-containing protein [Isosphaeraceae bacterium]|nr:methyltransferase domain-containing protein [Isosphaeraceae bacterium]